jgi:hypothetical protein
VTAKSDNFIMNYYECTHSADITHIPQERDCVVKIYLWRLSGQLLLKLSWPTTTKMMTDNTRTIRIPLGLEGTGYQESVTIFADELPVGDLDYNDVIDVLRSVLAPLKLWRQCAVSLSREDIWTLRIVDIHPFNKK